MLYENTLDRQKHIRLTACPSGAFLLVKTVYILFIESNTSKLLELEEVIVKNVYGNESGSCTVGGWTETNFLKTSFCTLFLFRTLSA